MIIRFIKFVVVFTSIFLLTGCVQIGGVILAGLLIPVTGTSAKSIMNITYNKEFFIFNYDPPYNDAKFNPRISILKNEVTSISKQHPQIQTSFLMTTSFEAEVVKNTSFLAPKYQVNLTIFNEPKKIDDDVVCPDLSEFGEDFFWQYYSGIYLLKDALDYQWHQGYVIFLDKYSQINNKKINDNDIQYRINANIFTDLDDIGNSTKKYIRKVSFHYKYDIDIFNNKTKKVYLSKKLQYDYNAATTTNNVAYYKHIEYLLPIIRKNREVIEREVFTDELYNALTNASQNSTTN